MNENYKPFKQEPKIIYERDSFKIVVGQACTNEDEKFCIGLRANAFPNKAYVIFMPQLSLNFLKSLLGEEGSDNEELIKAIKEMIES
ncbi:hypothetical protein [Campylobacter cuniculorum]|uniref:Uncharacterized protein n=2 Tax=Campylobacter cuniculorum TaxID=374106 RepID=A0A1W6BYK4_9BACT|nr:hypothetical protein [Campylobacter cuniculorum]ARJ57167.1 hypothetical protein CCUN_1587 [Campylobacter cuniculorum DSM 23162 = LMG 24588]QOR04608.1 hypothetical protein A0071_01265 [Campylobacter cuniculorum]